MKTQPKQANGAMLQAALDYAARGWPVFPCREKPGEPYTNKRGELVTPEPKSPYWHPSDLTNGVKNATTDPAIIRRWWGRWPGAAIGLDCGGAGLYAVDCDIKNGIDGIGNFEALGIDDKGALHSQTASGGLHILFAATGAPLGNTAGDLAPGIDTRGNGGYIILPPSQIETGQYCALDNWAHDPAPLPGALRAMLEKPKRQTQPAATSWWETPTTPGNYGAAALAAEAAQVAAAPEGQRNETLNRAAFNLGQLIAGGEILGESETLAALLDAARVCGLSEREALPTIESGLRAGKSEPRKRPQPAATSPARPRSGANQAQASGGDAPKLDAATEPASPPDPPDLGAIRAALAANERGDADILANLTGGRWVFDHAEKLWYTFEGHYWRSDRTGALFDLVTRTTAAQYLTLAADCRARDDSQTERAAIARASQLRARRRAENVLHLAARPTLAFAGAWDNNPWLLATPNGVVNLRTGAMRPGRPADYLKTAAATAYDPAATCPRWEAFLAEVLPDPEARAFMRLFLGYALTGATRDHVFPILWGDGRNGKGTLLETLGDVLGSGLTTSTQADALMETGRGDGNAPRPFVYALRGKRLVWASESNEGRRINAGLVKQLTGGDRLNVRTLHSEPVEFYPTHKILLLTNNKPHINADDQAAWDRVVLIPFVQRFVDNPQAANERRRDPGLREALAAEAPGILAWLVRACLDWQAGGLAIPESLLAATAAYREEEDTLGQFVEECCLVGPDYSARASDLYAAYTAWAGAGAMTQTAFGTRLKRRFDATHTAIGKVYRGLGLRS